MPWENRGERFMLKTKQEQQKFCREFNISADIFLYLPEASCTKKRVSEVTKSLIKLRVKIPADIIRRQKKPTENLHIHTLRPFHIPLCQRLLKIFQKIMPVTDKCLIPLKIRQADPFLYLYFGSVLFFALFRLEKIGKRAVLIKTPQRKQPAEAGAEAVDGTAAVFV